MKRPCNMTGDEAIGALLAFLILLVPFAFFWGVFALGASR